jgi:hypothetical protein
MGARQRRKREKLRRHDRASMRSVNRLAVGAGLTVGATLGFGASAEAANFEVDTALDPGGAGACTDITVGDCSLRQAVALSNASPAVDDTITFAAALSGNTIAVASGEIDITDAVYIYTNVADVSVSAGSSSRIFDIDATGDPGMNVGIYGLTLTDGQSASSGGAVYSNAADLTISTATISHSSTTGTATGGAIGLRSGSLTLQDSEISGNNTAGTGAGGAIYAHGTVANPTTVQISASTITGNSTNGGGDGGALYTYRSTTAIENSTVSGNSISGNFGAGGGIYSVGGEITVEGSTISGNSTDGDYGPGGGLRSVVSTTTIESSTVSGNSTTGATAAGGGVYSSDGTLAIRNSTIADNHVYAYANGGGVFATYVTPDPVLTNTIVADNSASGTGPDVFSGPSDVFQAAFTLIEDTQSSVINTTVPGSNIFGVDPGLQPLADNATLNGTETHALLPTSPVIDCGSSGSATTDQRGFSRPVDLPGRMNSTATGANGADMGAFELQAGSPTGACSNNPPPPPPAPTPTPGPTPSPAAPGPALAFNLQAAIKKCKKKFRKGPKRAKCIKKAKRRARA